MWYRINIDGVCKFVDSARYAELKAEGKEFETETKNKWIGGVVNEFAPDVSDGEILDEIINLIDDGECNGR